MQRPQLIKSFIKTICPDCSKPIFVCISFLPPGLSYVISDSEMEQNKRRLKEALKLVEFKDKTTEKETLEWVDSEDCVLGNEDVDDLVKSISEEQKE